MNRYDSLRHVHDLSLSDWGPYANDVFGASHIADPSRGLRMDFFMVPGISRRKFCAPETLRECDYSPWEAGGDLGFYSARTQLIGRNEFYADTGYAKISENFRLGRMEFVNRTAAVQSASLLLYARLAPRKEVAPVLAPGAVWLDAVDHVDLQYAYKRRDHNLVWDGGRRGQQQYPGTVGNRCIGQPYSDRANPCFGEFSGDSVRYDYSFTGAPGKILMRARLDAGAKLVCDLDIDGAHRVVTLSGSGEFALTEVFSGVLAKSGKLSLTSRGGKGGLRIDGFVLLPSDADPEAIAFLPIGHACAPHAVPGPVPNSNIITIANLASTYAVWWSRDNATEREYWADDLMKLLNYSYGLRQPYYNPAYFFDKKGDEYCKESYLIPIPVPAGGSVRIYTLYGTGDAAGVARELAAIDRSDAALEAAYEKARATAVAFPKSGAGATYSFSQQLMSAALMTNINFPIQAKGKNIRHHVPDKYYNSLYSWDSGFIGLGLLELDKLRAIENLNVYVTEPDDDECAFILHGTPLPVQAYLYAELWNRFQDRDMLEFFYPRLRHFYDFLAGHVESSTFREFKTNLLKGWDYFYNSGGWDDYPPQWRVYQDSAHHVAPAVLSAHTIRFAKFMAMAARTLGREADAAGFDADVAMLAAGLQQYSWDPEAEVFSYVEHDENGNFKGIYRDPDSGLNYNLGMDGASPLVAGICTEEQEDILFERLADPKHHWTRYGLSTVDMSAPYYRADGYWNGCVWMPHQWFFWKSALDADRAGFARQIAETALEVWKNEVDQSFYCFEHFSLINGRGCGCHHFGGLSSPVLNWFGAYFTPGRLTGGFDLWITRQHPEADGGITAELQFAPRRGRTAALLYVAGAGDWQVEYAGSPAVYENVNGTLEITVPADRNGTLQIRKAENHA